MSMIRPRGELRQKVQPYRKKAYREHVAKQPCMACGWALPNEIGAICQAAHIRTDFHTMSDKPDDWLTIPLCTEEANGCHAAFGAGEKRFAREVLDLSIDALKAKAKARWMAWESHQS